jgi:hypothetical protein
MGQIVHNTSLPDDGLGDALRQAFTDANTMNAELYATKVDKVAGKALSENDYTTAEKNLLASLDPLAEQNVQSDWNQTDPTADEYIKGKPTFLSTTIDVSAIWTSGLSFDVVANAYPVLDIVYASTPGVVTLDTADATLDRIDLIVAIAPVSPATIGTVGKITGTPASSSVVSPPDYDPSLVYVIKSVIVLAAATEPDGVANTQIYNEGTEWTVALSANVVQNTSDPSVGVNCLEATNWTSADSMTFTAPSPLSTADLDLLQFDIKLKEINVKKYLTVTVINGTHRLKTVYFRGPDNGFDYQNLSYQTVSLNKKYLDIAIQPFDAIEIQYFATTLGFYFDNFKLFKGSGSTPIDTTAYVPEAPIDGILYGRKDAQWETIPAAAADMSKSVYDPTNINSSAFDTDNMLEATVAKATPIDADTVSLFDSVTTSFKKLSWANIKTTLNLIYAPKFGTRVTNATVTGTYVIDHNAGNDFKLTMTGATVFSESNLPTGTNTLEFTIKLTGNFAPTYPAYWDVLGDTYDGTVWNFIAVQIHKGDATQEATAFISNF